MAKTYKINECFYSLQGEGARTGSANVFVRFSNCNLACKEDGPAGFDCDTEFESGKDMALDELLLAMEETGGPCRNTILTGGEPALQVDEALVDALKSHGWYVAIETNGTRELPGLIDWVCVSPKTAIHTIRVKKINELKFVRHSGHFLPDTSLIAEHYWLSPAFGSHGLDKEALDWCVKLVKENPKWKLSTQLHKIWHLR